MGGADRKSKIVRGRDGRRGGYFCRCALAVGQMIFADLFAHRHHDALPSHHRAQSERERHSHFDPDGDELGRLVDMTLIVRKHSAIRCR